MSYGSVLWALFWLPDRGRAGCCPCVRQGTRQLQRSQRTAASGLGHNIVLPNLHLACPGSRVAHWLAAAHARGTAPGCFSALSAQRVSCTTSYGEVYPTLTLPGGSQVAEGLAAIHARGMAHGCFSAERVLLTAAPRAAHGFRACVADYGLAPPAGGPPPTQV